MPRRLARGEAKGPKNSLVKLAKKVNRNAKILGSREIGRIRTNLDTTPSTTAVVQNVSLVAQGDDVGSRHGRKIHAMHVAIQGQLIKHTSAPGSFVRFVLFRDNLGTTDAPTLTDLFADENDFFQGQHRLINEQPMKRFTILWDKYFVLNENFDGQTTGYSFKFSKKLNFDILYTGTAVTDEGKNSLWFVSGSDEGTNIPQVAGDIVFRYSDL